MSDRILWTRFHAIPAEDATPIINVVDLGVTFIDTHALLGRSRIVGGDDVNALGRTRRRAQITGHALLSSKLVYVQQVLPAITRLHRDRLVGILDRPFALRNIRQRHTHSLDDRFRRFNYVSDD